MGAPSKEVTAVFAGYPMAAQQKILTLRSLIYSTAKAEDVGELTETLKWGQPSYLTKPKIGSTVRLGWSDKNPEQVSVYFICTTHLVDRFQEIYPDIFNFENGRVIHFSLNEDLPEQELSHCLAMALTYHRNKK